MSLVFLREYPFELQFQGIVKTAGVSPESLTVLLAEQAVL
jgi:hypothetical protein